MGWWDRLFRPASRTAPPAGTNAPYLPAVATEADHRLLEETLAWFGRVGLEPHTTLTMRDLEFVRPELFHDEPHRTLTELSDPSGDALLRGVLVYDAEMVEGPEDYPRLVRRLARATGTEYLLSDVWGEIDETAARFGFTLDGRVRRYEARVDGDWADPDVTMDLFDIDFDVVGRTQLIEDTGQGSIHYWVLPEAEDDFRAVFPDLV